MTLETRPLERSFRYTSIDLADPGAQYSAEEVRDLYTATYPELANAAIEGPEQKEGKLVYTFRRPVGTKGVARAADIRITEVSDSKTADSLGVARFAEAMKKKLSRKRREGKRGWNRTPESGWGCSVRELEQMLKQHLAKGDVIDVANFCMMVWNRRNPQG